MLWAAVQWLPVAAPAAGEETAPEAYRELESDCEKAGWGGAPTRN